MWPADGPSFSSADCVLVIGIRRSWGLKTITCYLNAPRIFIRDGGRRGVAQVHAIPTRTTYIGADRFNTRIHRDRTKKPKSEVATMAVPPLIDLDIFDAVQAKPKSRHPMPVPARITTSPVLLRAV